MKTNQIKLQKNESIAYIKDSNNLYKITSFGRVFSVKYRKTNRTKELSLNISNKGYARVGIAINEKRKFLSVHRLVLMAFSENIENKSQINHKDGNKLNNKLENLEWCTPKENIKHSIEEKLRMPQTAILKKTSTSGFSGVGYHKSQKKWQARIQVNKKRIRIGFFDTAEEASIAHTKYMEDNNIKKFIKKYS